MNEEREKGKILFWVEKDTKTGEVTIGNETGKVTLPREQIPLLTKEINRQIR